MSLFQIIIPMSGFGERFRQRGYSVPKPLIEVEGKPIIAHVINMFPKEKKIILICNRDHLSNPTYRMKEILEKFCPQARIVECKPHRRGPVYSVQQAKHLIDLNVPILVNYCDFCCYWNWDHFKKFVLKSDCVGAIPAYRGFHPHSLGKTHYAYMRESNGLLEDIREKSPYTNNRMEEFASSGTYYFSSGHIMLEAFQETVDQNLHVNGEFYVSLVYRALLAKKYKIHVYPLQHFMQWGTPEDLEEYINWSKTFKSLIDKKNYSPLMEGASIIPMAGHGKRFVDEGYREIKPLIPVSGRPMVIQAVNDLPKTRNQVFVLREDSTEYDKIIRELVSYYPNAIIETIPKITEGQACTALKGLDALYKKVSHCSNSVTFGSCDNGVLYNIDTFQRLIHDPKVDIIVWGIRRHTGAIHNPNMFGWIQEKNREISGISVKVPLDSPSTDPIAIGTFTFRKKENFSLCVKQLINRDDRVNNEFYIDSCINDAIEMGLRCYLFEVDSYISWGTPNDLKTFNYWQSCFHKWEGHPYRLELDERVPKMLVDELDKLFQIFKA